MLIIISFFVVRNVVVIFSEVIVLSSSIESLNVIYEMLSVVESILESFFKGMVVCVSV